MKITLFVFAILVLFGCNGEKKKLYMPDSTRWTDQDVPLNELDTVYVNTDSITISDEMKREFSPGDSIIEGRPVSFYMNRSDVSPVAKNFYLLRFIPSDDERTFAFCDSMLTKNDTTRPFYYFLFARLMRIADGGLAEGMSVYAQKYFFEYPKEFYMRLQNPLYRQNYGNWVDLIAYSLMIPDNASPTGQEMRDYLIQQQKKKIKIVSPLLLNQMVSFADSVANVKLSAGK